MSGESLPTDLAEWATVFSRFADVVLVANSDDVDLDALRAAFGPRTLFVFFNKTYKVLDGPFERPSLLVARSSEAGANIVYRREVEKVLKPFDSEAFLGIANLRVSERENFSRPEEFGSRAVGFLDLSGVFATIYPGTHLPTSGFALALWLAEQRLGIGIHLAGFTARRSARWKLFADHDWTFEQTALRLLANAGLIRLTGERAGDLPFTRFAERFPEIDRADIAIVAATVVADRLANTDRAVDRLFSLTRLQGRLDTWLRSMKPQTRKERLRKTQAEEGGSQPRDTNGLAKTSRSD
ncbi:3-deoxy-manno-octulosonate cytidylyltransferase [Aureimonas psammosilenae]|uniref:3-deoxy-manno-octulosonate cytidylyltransferase n=1 Tax=Aureimonas psammosilenae TaxID=2495496 RepID=UPI001260FB7D|nr:3-deoxy-manno-octulosonate cytidylyltransferase [Aureimonas psammosilenae]